MELGSILHFLQHKTVLITGATGFLAKSTLSLSLSLFGPFKGYLLHDDIITCVCMYGYYIYSSCGEDIEGSAKCEEAVSSFKSTRHQICHSSPAQWGIFIDLLYKCDFHFQQKGYLCFYMPSLSFSYALPNLQICHHHINDNSANYIPSSLTITSPNIYQISN